MLIDAYPSPTSGEPASERHSPRSFFRCGFSVRPSIACDIGRNAIHMRPALDGWRAKEVAARRCEYWPYSLSTRPPASPTACERSAAARPRKCFARRSWCGQFTC